MIGEIISQYKILEKLGEGGMGVVYKAEDTKLDRIVALKFLPQRVTSNNTEKARFLQEAKAASAINHPHVCVIHDIQEYDDRQFIVMEYIEGQTLRQIIADNHPKVLNQKQVIDYAIQIAEALQAAHKKEIVHRDIKSDNIMITGSGQVKVMDFGLAKLRGSLKLTKTSSTVGTLAYMAPEQIQGKGVDVRSDIFSFGVVLYEMLTGRLPFQGEYESSLMYAILNEEPPPVQKYRNDISSELLHVLNRTLEKESGDRYQSVDDLLIDLRRLKRDSDRVSRVSLTEMPAAPSDGKSIASRKIILLFGGLIMLAVVLFGMFHFIGREKIAPPFQHMHITRLTTHGQAKAAAISPDGKYAVHVKGEEGQLSLWLRQIATESDVQIIPPDDVSYYGLTFSKDGNFVYYVIREKGTDISELYRIPVLGGSSTKIMEEVYSSISFSPDGEQFAFLRWNFSGGESSLITAKMDGTSEKVLAKRPLSNGFSTDPVWSPDGKSIVCGSWFPADNAYALVSVSLDGSVRMLHEKKWTSLSTIAWSPEGNGIILTARNKPQPNFQIWYFNPSNGTMRRITNDVNDYRSISLTDDGKTLLTVQSEQSSDIWIVPGANTSRARQITSTKNSGAYGVVWTPDGRIVHASRDRKLWIVDGDGNNRRLLSSDYWSDMRPEVTPDGRYIIFDRSQGAVLEVWRMDIEGGTPVRLDSLGTGPRCTPDGKWILYKSLNNDGVPVTCKIPVQGGEKIFLPELLAYEFDISPDGNLIAGYAENEDTTGRWDIVVVPVEGGDPAYTFTGYVSDAEGVQWAPDGKSITFIMGSGGDVANIWKQPLAGGPPVQITDFKEYLIFAYDWSRDGDLVCSRGVVDNDVVLIRDIQ
jgi:serine/threonine protein kinase